MKFNKDMLLLYAVTDRGKADRRTFYEQVRKALSGGVTIVQLREKNLNDDEFLTEASELRELCHSYGVPLIINDNVDVALKSGADGVHVGLDDMPVSKIRMTAGASFIIGATAKTVEQARLAQNSGADYLGVGAVFPSPTKKDAVRITNEQLRKIAHSVNIPIVAIGGINLDNALEIKNSGVSGIAVVSAIFSAGNITNAAEQLKEKAKTVVFGQSAYTKI